MQYHHQRLQPRQQAPSLMTRLAVVLWSGSGASLSSEPVCNTIIMSLVNQSAWLENMSSDLQEFYNGEQFQGKYQPSVARLDVTLSTNLR